MLREIERFLRDETGLEMLEWSIVAAMIGLACSIVYSALGFALSGAVINLANVF